MAADLVETHSLVRPPGLVHFCLRTGLPESSYSDPTGLCIRIWILAWDESVIFLLTCPLYWMAIAVTCYIINHVRWECLFWMVASTPHVSMWKESLMQLHAWPHIFRRMVYVQLDAAFCGRALLGVHAWTRGKDMFTGGSRRLATVFVPRHGHLLNWR